MNAHGITMNAPLERAPLGTVRSCHWGSVCAVRKPYVHAEVITITCSVLLVLLVIHGFQSQENSRFKCKSESHFCSWL